MPRCWDVRALHLKGPMRAQQNARKVSGICRTLRSRFRNEQRNFLLPGPVGSFMLKLRGLSPSADMKPLTSVKSVTTTRSHNLSRFVGPSRSAEAPQAWQICLKLVAAIHANLTPLEADLLRPTGASLFSAFLPKPTETFLALTFDQLFRRRPTPRTRAFRTRAFRKGRPQKSDAAHSTSPRRVCEWDPAWE